MLLLYGSVLAWLTSMIASFSMVNAIPRPIDMIPAIHHAVRIKICVKKKDLLRTYEHISPSWSSFSILLAWNRTLAPRDRRACHLALLASAHLCVRRRLSSHNVQTIRKRKLKENVKSVTLVFTDYGLKKVAVDVWNLSHSGMNAGYVPDNMSLQRKEQTSR